MSSSIPVSMKFNGKVYRVNDKSKYKIVTCKGDGEVILNHSFTSSQFGDSTPSDSSYITRLTIPNIGSTTGGTKKNAYAANSETDDIMKSLITLADSSFNIVVGSTYDPHTMSGKYIAEGSFLSNVKTILNGLADSGFWSNGRKTFFLEKDEGIVTGLEFKSSQSVSDRGVRVLDMGESDNYLVNSVELIGRQNLKHGYGTIGSVSNGTTVQLPQQPINLRITHSSSLTPIVEGVGGYSVNHDQRIITFLASGSDIKIEYDYEDVSTNSDNYYLHTDSTSIGIYGKRHRRYFVPQLTARADFQRLAQKIISHNDTVKSRFQIELPYLANNIRENHRCKIINKKGTFDDQVIKQIEYHYPAGRTIIQVGENLIDGFDLDQNDSLNLASTVSSIQKTKVQ